MLNKYVYTERIYQGGTHRQGDILYTRRKKYTSQCILLGFILFPLHCTAFNSVYEAMYLMYMLPKS